ncbi:helix-turn-helix domain-containing protein [Variovorax saccharolyticus]|uniref:helix-turn-helix domain-containing protein n=1 Tax=Variovorax saccharolyticus TaxID=3053516 RepID=UPI002577AB44|nr:helix-turn-helix transcriptional regulator [Variovorax sp. J22R187]MDM0018380.1 helix-turn-helix transcriptional regulator [Variovorax sp. J22R187]
MTIAAITNTARPAHDQGVNSINTSVSAANDGGAGARVRSDAESTRDKENDRLRRIIGPRLVLAREQSGLHQGEAARLLGLGNPTQLALWENSRRLVPMVELIRVADLYSVSVGYLLGTTNEVERDPARALRAATVRGLRGMLDGLAVGLVDAIGAHAAAVGPDVVSARAIVAAGQALIDALGVAMRAPEFDDIRGGASVIRAVLEFESRLDEVRSAIKKFDLLDLDLRERIADAVAANDGG